MKCTICEEIKTVEEISANDGMCKSCADILADRNIDAGDESDPEVRDAVKRYLKRREYMAKYNARPDVREARKAYMDSRREKDAKLLKRAKELGLI